MPRRLNNAAYPDTVSRVTKVSEAVAANSKKATIQAR